MSETRLRSAEEVVDELGKHGIRVIYKPVALMPLHIAIHGSNRHQSPEHEMDIYKALSMLENRVKISKDPFSK